MIDLFAGLGGWAEGGLAESYDVVGFDIENHVYGDHCYPGQLVVQDVRTLHGSQFKDASLIVASPPCQEYSYMAMPWSRAKQIMRALKGEDEFPEGYGGSRTVGKLNELFDACFRIQREACAATGRHIPMVVENVRGAQPWVGRAAWNFGSYYLWGDVPTLMPIISKRAAMKDGIARSFQTESVKNTGGSWFNIAHNTTSGCGNNPDGRKGGGDWFSAGSGMSLQRSQSSKSSKRKFASAMIAKIPFELSRHIARVYKPQIAEQTGRAIMEAERG